MSTTSLRHGYSVAALRSAAAAAIEDCACEGAWYWERPTLRASFHRETVSLPPTEIVLPPNPRLVAFVALRRRNTFMGHIGPSLTVETLWRGKRRIECHY